MRTVEPYRDSKLPGRFQLWLEQFRRLVNTRLTPRTATTAELVDITNAVNTGPDKQAGYEVFNTTTGAPVWAVGSADGSVWNDATGATAHTPT